MTPTSPPLNTAPFAPSRLSSATTATTPITVLTTTRHSPTLRPHPLSPLTKHTTPLPPPPQPLPWLWQCHICHRTYRLSVTRRCLDDGHYFCAGESGTLLPTRKRRRSSVARKRAGKACASEFDYGGWSVWGSWRRGVEREVQAASHVESFGSGLVSQPVVSLVSPNILAGGGGGGWKGCSNKCDYPSECRWGREAQLERIFLEDATRGGKATNMVGTVQDLSPRSPEVPELRQLREWFKRQKNQEVLTMEKMLALGSESGLGISMRVPSLGPVPSVEDGEEEVEEGHEDEDEDLYSIVEDDVKDVDVDVNMSDAGVDTSVANYTPLWSNPGLSPQTLPSLSYVPPNFVPQAVPRQMAFHEYDGWVLEEVEEKDEMDIDGKSL